MAFDYWFYQRNALIAEQWRGRLRMFLEARQDVEAAISISAANVFAPDGPAGGLVVPKYAVVAAVTARTGPALAFRYGTPRKSGRIRWEWIEVVSGSRAIDRGRPHGLIVLPEWAHLGSTGGGGGRGVIWLAEQPRGALPAVADRLHAPAVVTDPHAGHQLGDLVGARLAVALIIVDRVAHVPQLVADDSQDVAQGEIGRLLEERYAIPLGVGVIASGGAGRARSDRELGQRRPRDRLREQRALLLEQDPQLCQRHGFKHRQYTG